MSLHDMIQADAVSVFCNPNDHAEPVTYYKRDGRARPIDAVVERQALQLLIEDGDNVIPIFEIYVANDRELGISSEELNLGGDTIAFAIRVGQPISQRTITKLLGHDEGMLILECR